MKYYKLDKNHRWNTDPNLRDRIGIVYRVSGGKKVKVTWFSRKDIWSYFINSKEAKTEESFWNDTAFPECNNFFSKCTKKEAEEMLGYKI
jgi:hypothetical protein